MKLLKYLIFLLFNLAYKDGNYKENDTPYFSAAGVVMLYEGCIIEVCLFFLAKHINIEILTYISETAQKVVYGYGFLMCAWLFPINYYFFVKREGFHCIYNEFKHAKINTKRNRIIGYICLILYWPIMCVIVGHLKFWFP